MGREGGGERGRRREGGGQIKGGGLVGEGSRHASREAHGSNRASTTPRATRTASGARTVLPVGGNDGVVGAEEDGDERHAISPARHLLQQLKGMEASDGVDA